MALCKLTTNWGGGTPIYVNPLHVIAVHTQSEGTIIVTSAPQKEGHWTIYVTEQAQEVADLLDAHMPRYA